MRKQSPASYMVGTDAAFAVLASCSGGSPIGPATPGVGAGNFVVQRSAPAGSRHTTAIKTFMHPEAVGKPLVFVSDELNNVVYIYLQAGKNRQVGEITGLSYPEGLATDAFGNLFVPNQFSVTDPDEVSRVFVFAPPYTKGPRVLSDADYFPVDVAVSPQGVVAVAISPTLPSL